MTSFKETFILRVVQLLGLKPYELDSEQSSCRRSLPISVYNIVIAVLVFVNAYETKKNHTYDIDFTNITLVIGMAYAAVDFFGNLYICYAMVQPVLDVSVSVSAWMRFRTVDRLLSSRFIFDHNRMKSVTCVQIFFVFLLSITFTVNEFICFRKLNMNIVISHQIASLLPLFYSMFISFLFGSLTLVLFQRFWVVNYALEQIADNMSSRLTHISADISTSENWSGPRFIPKEAFYKTKKPPVYIMLKDREEIVTGEENFLDEIKMLRKIHFELYQIIHGLNSSFGFHFFFQFTYFFFGSTTNIYYVFIYHLGRYELYQFVSSFFWSFLFLFLASYVVFHSNLVTNEAGRTIELVHLILTRVEFCDTELQREINNFSSQLMQCPVQFQGGGFFFVNSHLIFQFLTGVLSSIMFVIQLDKTNFEK